jgi:hypothetical protein
MIRANTPVVRQLPLQVQVASRSCRTWQASIVTTLARANDSREIVSEPMRDGRQPFYESRKSLQSQAFARPSLVTPVGSLR